MDRKILNERIQNLENELPKISNLLFSMKLANTDEYPSNYNQLCLEVSRHAEKMACNLRSLYYSANLVSTPEVLSNAASAQGIAVVEKDGIMEISIPALLPKRDSRFSYRTNYNFLAEPLRYALEEYCRLHPYSRFGQCVICFHHQYENTTHSRFIRDYDNQECKQIQDIIAACLLTDDTALLCDVFHTISFGPKDCTTILLMTRDKLPGWLKSLNSPAVDISDF